MNTQSRQRRALIALAGVATMTMLGMTACRAEETLDRGEPLSANEIAQTAVTDADGIRIEALGALFSGTETALRLRITSDDHSVTRVAPTENALASPNFGDGKVEVMPGRDGGMVVKLPPYQPPAGYDGIVPVEFSAFHLSGGATNPVTGSWIVHLTGPDPDDVDAVLRAEELGSEEIVVEGEAVTVSGVRSTSETRITVTHSTRLKFLVPPQITVDGVQHMMVMGNDTDSGQWALFPPTPFGIPVAVDLGTVATEGDSGTVLTINIGAALARAGMSLTEGMDAGGPSVVEFPIEPGDVIDGPAELVLLGTRSARPGQELVGVNLDGSWHPVHGPNGETVSPRLWDQDGRPLEISGMGIGYTKDDAGNVSPGVTEISVIVAEPESLETITLQLGPSSVTGERPVVELSPVGAP